MTAAYDKSYLEKARTSLGRMLDFAVYDLKYDITEFFNMFVVWLLTGVWHGASWNFILWGLYFFTFLVIEKVLLKDKLKTLDSFAVWKKILLHIYTLAVVLFGWVLFRATTLSGVLGYIKAMFGI